MIVSRIVAWFMKFGATFLFTGIALGVLMHHQHQRGLLVAHVHVTLAGGVLPILYALSYQQFPALLRSRLAAVHLGLHAGASLVLLILLITHAIANRTFDDALPHSTAALSAAAGLAFTASVLAFTANVCLGLASAPSPRRATADRHAQ